jgi:long-chain acyl-CoA synthetase
MYGFYSSFLKSADRFPQRVAAELQRTSGAVESLTYSELRRQAESVGRWLRERGIPSGARCAILAENTPSWVSAYLGVMAAGAAAVPLDTAFNAGQIEKLLRDCGATVIFTDGRHLPAVERAAEKIQVQIATLDDHPKFPSFPVMLAAGPATFIPAAVENSDLAVIMYTSGTTSDPKGVMLTHANLLAETESVLGAISVSERDSILAVLPLFHALAQMTNLLLPFAAGARIVYLEEMNTSELLRALGERDVTLFCCVPQFFYLIHERITEQVHKRPWAARTAFRILLSIGAAGGKMGLNLGKLFFAKIHRMLGPRMRYLVTGGSAFDPRIGRDLQKLGFNVLQGYGLTETTGAAFVTPPDANVMGSVGRPLPGVKVKIIDPQAVEGLNYPVGEIAISGGMVMKGYYNRPDATAQVLKDGWLLSGDLGYLDSHGNLFITGRKKEIIVLSSGKNIYPEEIEAQYLRSPFIKEICVMGLTARPGEPLSERLHAVIVPDFDVLRERKIVNAREVIRFDVENLSMELPSTKRILSFDLWSDPLPRTTTRKLKRFEILRRVHDAGEGQTAEAASTVAEEPTGEEAVWLSDPDVQKAIAVIRRSTKSEKPILPSSNLELDLGFDSMERVELVVALEGELSSEADDKVISEVYTVRELVDTLLQARNGAGRNGSARAAAPGWDAVLGAPPDDPHVLAALNGGLLPIFAWFVFGRFVSLFMRVFFQLRVSGKEKLPAKGPFILSPNHQSFIDGPVVASQIPWRLFKDMFYVGTSEVFGQGIFNYLGRTFRLIPVDPDSNLVNAMRAGAFGLKRGYNLVLYPEGERSIDGTPKKFKKGAAILATHLQIPIYPVALEGFYDSWPRGKRFPRLSKLRIRFGDPIQPPAAETASEETYRQVTETLRDRVVEMWEGLREQTTPTSTAADEKTAAGK